MKNSKNDILQKLIRRRLITESECWLFTGPSGITKKEIYIKGKNYLVSRVSAWIHLKFDLFSHLLICHKCKSRGFCWNPEHIYIGNTSSNTKDSIADGTFRNPNTGKTHCKQGHELSGTNLYTWEDYKTGEVHRWCRTCRTKNAESYRSKNK